MEEYLGLDNLPEPREEVKLVITCPRRGKDWQQTTTGYYKGGGHWHIRNYSGLCYTVKAWAPLNSKTENYGTESL